MIYGALHAMMPMRLLVATLTLHAYFPSRRCYSAAATTAATTTANKRKTVEEWWCKKEKSVQ